MAVNRVVRVACVDCGGGSRKHKVLREFTTHWCAEDVGGGATHQIIRCQECDSIKFRSEAWSSDYLDPESGELEKTVRIYPEQLANARQPMSVRGSLLLPPEIDRIHRETITALNAGALILAGAGLRAIVEAICINAQAPGGNLQQKIDGLVKLNLLAQPQAELLHEGRYLGNAAVHEVETPARRHIADGLVIVEALMDTMYVAPVSAERLRQHRMEKSVAKMASSARSALAKEQG